MKHFTLKLFFIFLFIGFIQSCEEDKYVENDLNEAQNLKDGFTLENFENVFVKNNLTIIWDDYTVQLDSLTGREIENSILVLE